MSTGGAIQATHVPPKLSPLKAKEVLVTSHGPQQVPGHVVLDGRIFDDCLADSTARRPKAVQEDNGFFPAAGVPKSTLAKGTQARPRVNKEGKPLVTPPKVSAFGLAPVPDYGVDSFRPAVHAKQSGLTNAARANGGSHTQIALDRHPLLAQGYAFHQLRPTGEPSGSNAQHNSSSSSSSAMPRPPSLRLVMYQEINEADSLCATPPCLDLDLIRSSVTSKGPLGPFSPTPLSPSILTMCGDQAFGWDPANMPEVNWSAEPSGEIGSDTVPPGLASDDSLVNM